jgi:hypothetical protein
VREIDGQAGESQQEKGEKGRQSLWQVGSTCQDGRKKRQNQPLL